MHAKTNYTSALISDGISSLVRVSDDLSSPARVSDDISRPIKLLHVSPIRLCHVSLTHAKTPINSSKFSRLHTHTYIYISNHNSPIQPN